MDLIRRKIVLFIGASISALLGFVGFKSLRGQGFMSNQSNKTVRAVVSPKENHWVGNGFFVSTIFSVFDMPYEILTPFILMDHAAPKNFPPTDEKLGVGEHPHRGFETVTFAIKGEVEHRDSGGGGGVIGTGDVQWMTAASGVVHDEFHSREFAKVGGEFEMVQLWVNLPAKDKMTKPKYQSLSNKSFKRVELDNGNAIATLIAGELLSEVGPASTHTPISIYRLKSQSEAKLKLQFGHGRNTLLFLLRGRADVEGKELNPRQMVALSREGEFATVNMATDSEFLVLNGQPIDEPIVHYGPFVMNTEDEIKQAIMDFQAGKMGTLLVEEGS